MIIREYISAKFQTFGITLSEADLVDISLNANVDLDSVLYLDNKRQVEIAMAMFIPSLLLRPQSISEAGFSVSYDTKGIRDYYSFLCKQYGITDKLNPKPTTTFL